MRKPGLLILLTVVSFEALAQLTVVPISRSGPGKSQTARIAQTQQTDTTYLTPIALPFWDDFSFSNSTSFPHDTIWQYGQSVTLNDGGAILAPSLGVITFDGLDSAGRAYNLSNPLAKGFADRLLSRPLRLDLVSPPGRDSVYMSFFYQANGNGEDPDTGDFLSVDFLNASNTWINKLIIDRTEDLDPTRFYYTRIKINEEQFFHENFQFRIRNFGRLSGPYDKWNLDYIYVNDGLADTTTSFPDRALGSPPGSFLKSYFAIPAKHFVSDIPGNLAPTHINVSNLAHATQGASIYVTGNVISYLGSTPSIEPIPLDSANDAIEIPANFSKTVDFFVPDDLDSRFVPAADSFKIILDLVLNSSDDKSVFNPNPNDKGDYDPRIYAPIQFKINDTLKFVQYISNYYAYDDGSAEYGIGLNQANTQVAYKFEMVTPNPDTVVAVDLYFPHFGDESSQTLLLRILRDLSDSDESLLYEETIPVLRGEHNQFYRHKLDRRTVGVQGSFYVGWKQSVLATIPIGWDKNTDSGDKIWFNTNGIWEQNQEHGSMMIRPVFGKGDIPTGIVDMPDLNVYPNPSNGTFYLSQQPDALRLVDVTGKTVSFQSEKIENTLKIAIDYPQPGLYILKTVVHGQATSHKIIIRQ